MTVLGPCVASLDIVGKSFLTFRLAPRPGSLAPRYLCAHLPLLCSEFYTRRPSRGPRGDHEIGHQMCKKLVHRALWSRWSPQLRPVNITEAEKGGPPTPEGTMY